MDNKRANTSISGSHWTRNLIREVTNVIRVKGSRGSREAAPVGLEKIFETQRNTPSWSRQEGNPEAGERTAHQGFLRVPCWVGGETTDSVHRAKGVREGAAVNGSITGSMRHLTKASGQYDDANKYFPTLSPFI